jgi:predicted TIM-barrel fold metal-dependent hydrolase
MIGVMTRRSLLCALPPAAAPQTAKAPRIIDSHVHVWKRDPRFPWAKETGNPPGEDRSAEMLLELMKANGVARTVIIQVIHYRWDNSYLADVLQRYPKMFHGVARVDPENPAAPDHVSQLTGQRFRGIRLSPNASPASDWIRGPLMPPLWKRCEQLKVPMTLLAPVSRMPDAARLIGKYPELTVVIDHMADSPARGTRESCLRWRDTPKCSSSCRTPGACRSRSSRGATLGRRSSASATDSAPSASCGAPTGR